MPERGSLPAELINLPLRFNLVLAAIVYTGL